MRFYGYLWAGTTSTSYVRQVFPTAQVVPRPCAPLFSISYTPVVFAARISASTRLCSALHLQPASPADTASTDSSGERKHGAREEALYLQQAGWGNT